MSPTGRRLPLSFGAGGGSTDRDIGRDLSDWLTHLTKELGQLVVS